MELIKNLKSADFISLISLAFAWGSIVLIFQNLPFYSIVCTIIAFFFDTLDGYIARRNKNSSVFGRNLDGTVDLVNYVIFSALFSYFFVFESLILKIVAGFLIICFGVLRLTRMNVEGIKQTSEGRKYYEGVVTTHIPPIIIILYYLKQLNIFNYEYLFFLIIITFSFLMISKLKTYKPSNYLFIYLFCLALLAVGFYLEYKI